MHIITQLNNSRFTYNGIQYFKNYLSVPRGNRIEVFNCYDRKDVLIPLTLYSEISVNGTVYGSVAELQENLMPVIYSRSTLEEGGGFDQNNKLRNIVLGYTFSDTVPVSDFITKMNNRTTVISPTDTPVILAINQVGDPEELTFNIYTKIYSYFFKPGKGTYGIGGTPVIGSMLQARPITIFTPDDIDPDSIKNIDPVVDGDYITKANTLEWDFGDSGNQTDNGVKQYYISFTNEDGVLTFALFVGLPGQYGVGGLPLDSSMFILTTSENVDPDDFVRKTGEPYQKVEGSIAVTDKMYITREIDGLPTGFIGYIDLDKSYNLNHNSGGGGSFNSFSNNNVETGRFAPDTNNFLVGTVVDVPEAKVNVNGNTLASGNAYAANFSNLKGKTWVIFGDSFSADIEGPNGKYPQIVRSNLDLSANSYAVSGNLSSQQLAVLKDQLIANPDFLDIYDIISLHIGVNDFANGTIPLGSMSSTIGDGSVSGNVKDFIETALTAKPNIKFFLITPPEADGAGVPFKVENSLGWRLQDLSTLYGNIGMYYGIQVIDLYSMAQFNPLTVDYFTFDGLHPNNPAGITWIGNIVSQAFLSNVNKGREVNNDRILHTDSSTEYKAGELEANKFSTGKTAGNGQLDIYTQAVGINPNYTSFKASHAENKAGIWRSNTDWLFYYDTSTGSTNISSTVANQPINFKDSSGTDIFKINTDSGNVVSTKEITIPPATAGTSAISKGQVDTALALKADITSLPVVITQNEVIDFPDPGSHSAADAVPFTVTGAAVGDEVAIIPPLSILTDGTLIHCVFSAFVSAANEVTARVQNSFTSGVTIPSANYKIIIRK